MSSEQATLTAFASLLDTSADAHEPTVEISSLRRLAARGIPSHPPHLRPTTYSVLLGVLPKHKARWKEERTNGRRKYVDFAIRFLEDVEQAPPPTHPLSPNDRLLDEISKDVRRTQVHLDFFSKPVFASAASDEASPSTPSLPARLRSSLSHRIVRLSTTGKDAHHNSPTRAKKLAVNAPPSLSPSMRSDDTARPSETRHDETSASPSDSPRNESLALPHIPELDFGTHSFGLVDSPAKASKPTNSTAASAVETSDFSTELHSDGLTRILYVFSLIHPQLSYTQGYAELLAPLYWVYASQGASLDDAASDEDDGGQWAEPDAFWAFLALMGEIGEVVKGPGHRPWGEVDLTVGGRPELDIQWALSRLSARVKWADETLWNDLRAKSLDPAQPFYAFRWVSTLLAQDVPLPSLLLIWDVILSEPPISHDSLPKVDLLLDVCTAMILLIRQPLLQAGRRRSAHIGLWETSEEDAGEFGPGFVEGMAILQRYPIEEIGVGRVIDLALESRQRRILAELNGDGPEDFQAVAFARTSTAAAATSTLSRLFKSHRSTPSVSAADVTRGTQGLASPTKARATSTYGASIARYAEAFRESDTAAALSKRSSNLTAAAVARWEDYQHRLPAVAEDEHSPSAPAENTLQTSNALTGLRSSGETSPRPHFLDPSGGRTPVRRSSLSPSEPLRSSPTQDSRPQGRSLQDRLAASLATPPAATPPPRSHARSPSSGSKPLLLSSSAQPPSSSPSAASVLHATHRSRPAWATDPLLGNRAPATTERASSPPPHFAPSASDSEASSRIPIGGSRRRSGQLQHQQSPTPLSPPGPIRTTFLKTTPKTQEAGIKLRAVQDQFISSSASPSPIGRLSADLSANANGQRNLPRSPRSKGLGRPESFSSAGGDSDGDPAIRSGNWLARGMSAENTQRGWTLTDNGPVSVPLEPPATVLPPLERLQMADASSIAPTVSGVASSHISQHARNQSSASSLGSPASPIGPRQPRKSSRAAVVSKQPARSTSSTRPHGRESSNPSDRDADDEDSTAEILESYGESDSAAGIR